MTDRIQMLIDGNATGYTAHHGDKIVTADGMETQAVHGFLSTIRDLKTQFPSANIIVLWDGLSWRKGFFPSYKEHRDADLTQFDPATLSAEADKRRYEAAVKKASVRASYKAQGPYIEEALRHLGIPQVTCLNYEADDLAALFADRYVQQGLPVRLVTSDGDWQQLVADRVVWKSHRAPFTFISLKNFEEKTGFKNPKLFVEAKILAGDKGDEVPGIPGFGEVTVSGFFKTFPGGFDEFFGLPLDFIEPAWRATVGKKAPKCVMELSEAGANSPLLARNRTLVDLRTPDRPAPSSIKIDKGNYDPDALHKFAKSLDLYKVSGDLPKFLSAFTGAT